jgi:hypothetical protein
MKLQDDESEGSTLEFEARAIENSELFIGVCFIVSCNYSFISHKWAHPVIQLDLEEEKVEEVWQVKKWSTNCPPQWSQGGQPHQVSQQLYVYDQF